MDTTRPKPDTAEELIWLRGFEAGVIQMREDLLQRITELESQVERLRGENTAASITRSLEARERV